MTMQKLKGCHYRFPLKQTLIIRLRLTNCRLIAVEPAFTNYMLNTEFSSTLLSAILDNKLSERRQEILTVDGVKCSTIKFDV